MTNAQRPGTRWVIVQMLLLAAVGATAPAFGGHWPTLVSAAPGALLWSSPAGMVLAAILAVFLDAKARHEERLLCQHFPDYPQYMRRVPRYLPRPPA